MRVAEEPRIRLPGVRLPGHHHLHMKQAPAVAAAIRAFRTNE
jgi:hypothetical protein